MMKYYDLIQVLWVEDDKKVINTYPAKAKNFFGLQLVHFPCWDDAEKALEEEYDRWSAIILDAKCKHHRDSADNAVRFLGEALKSISNKAVEKRRVIPWYVLTGGDESEVSDSINEDRLKWDRDWTESKHKNFYSKATDRDELYRRIRYHANISPRLQIHKMYHNVFEAIEECGIDDACYNAIEDLLMPVHFPDEIDAVDYNDKFQKARDVLEYTFRSMSSYGILPDWGKQVNLSASSHLIAGIDFTNKKGELIVKSKASIIPEELAGVMKVMVRVIPPFCHSDSGKHGGIRKKEYMKHVDNSTFLLKSFTLQFCDIILWYRNYLQSHKDKTENSKNWEIINEKMMRR